MAYDFNESTGILNDNILWTTDSMVYEGVTLTSGTAFKRGNMVGKITATGYYGLYDSAAANGVQNPAGIVVDDVDATAGALPGSIYVQGEFIYGKITAQSPAVVAPGIYYNGNILVKEAI